MAMEESGDVDARSALTSSARSMRIIDLSEENEESLERIAMRVELKAMLDAARYVARTYERTMLFLDLEKDRIEEQAEYVAADVASLRAAMEGGKSVVEMERSIARTTDYRTSNVGAN
jgi:hypothetical protein